MLRMIKCRPSRRPGSRHLPDEFLTFHSRHPVPLPSKEDLLAFIGKQAGKVGTREIARAFGLKNADRAVLKQMLRDLADGGAITKRRRKLHHAGVLPSVVLADITGRDADGELIAVPAEWDEAQGEAPKIRLHAPRGRRPGEVPGVGDRALLRTEPSPDAADDVRYQGHAIKVIDRAKHRVLGIFRQLAGGSDGGGRAGGGRGGDSGGRLVPIDKKNFGRELAIPAGATGGAEEGDLVAVEVSRGGRLGPPTGRVKERLGSLASEKAVSLIAIHAHGIPHEFGRDALREAAAARPVSLGGREDWRDVPFVTIDPADARDHDDAVFARSDTDPHNAGGFIIDVAIADVAHYVTPGSALDREALARGNSVYFPDRVVPMLPERISNDLCSLKPGIDRPAVAVRMTIGADGRKREHRFHRVLIRSAAKLHYAQAQAAIDGRPDEATAPLLALVIAPLFAAYAALKRARDERGPLDLDLPERKLLLRPDNSVAGVITPPRLEAHRLIEEFMILANVAAAETLERARVPFIYRVHDEPSVEKLHALREFLATLDISLPRSGALRPEGFNRILDRVRGRDIEKLVNEVVLRSQAQAEYAAENYGHFGLNLRRYAHFTSPIRRYADLVVHRALIRALKFGDDGLPRRRDRAGARRSRGAHLGGRAARACGRARDLRPPGRPFSRRPDRRDVAGPCRRRHPVRPVRQARRDAAPTASFRQRRSATNISATMSGPHALIGDTTGADLSARRSRYGAPCRGGTGRRRVAVRDAVRARRRGARCARTARGAGTAERPGRPIRRRSRRAEADRQASQPETTADDIARDRA